MLYILKIEFEWNELKSKSNIKKHKVSFAEATTIWRDLHSIEIFDPDSSKHEERWIRIGLSNKSRLLVVVYKEEVEDFLIRIISARKATLTEINHYEGNII